MGQLLLYEAPGDPFGAPYKVGPGAKCPSCPPPPLSAALDAGVEDNSRGPIKGGLA